MMYTGAGMVAFLVWLGTVAGSYFVIDTFGLNPWASLAIACLIAAVAVGALGRSLNRHGNQHTVFGVPAQWLGLAAPAAFGLCFGLAELIR